MATKTSAPRSSAPKRPRRFGKKAALFGAVTLVGVLGPTGIAFAGTSTSTSKATSGSLSIGTITSESISAPVAGTGTGILPSAPWSDTTGTGDGWNGTVAVSDFTYTGAWTQPTGTLLALASSTSAFLGTADGVEYTVTVGTGTTTSTPFTWTSTDPTDKAGGSGTATNGTAIEVGTTGLWINFTSGTAYSAETYQIDAGTQAASALSLDTSAATGESITPSSTTTSPNPAWVGNSANVTGGGVGATAYGSPVQFVSAALNTGMGTYTLNPGASISLDSASWDVSYTAGVQYSIVTGP